MVEQVVRRERQQRCSECNPPVGCEAAEREICEDRRDCEEQQHEDSSGHDLGGRVTGDWQGGRLHGCVAGRREAVVRRVTDCAVVVYEPTMKPLEAVFGGEVHGYRQVFRGCPVVIVPSVETPSVVAEHEHRRQRKQQQGEG